MDEIESETTEAMSSEDEADAAVFAEHMADLAAGSDERLPPEVSKAMLDGQKSEAVRVQPGTPRIGCAFRT